MEAEGGNGQLFLALREKGIYLVRLSLLTPLPLAGSKLRDANLKPVAAARIVIAFGEVRCLAGTSLCQQLSSDAIC